MLRDDASAALDAKAAVLLANPGVTLTITGNTDERGTAEYNLALGQRRAATVKRYLGGAWRRRFAADDAEPRRLAAGGDGHRRVGIPDEPPRGVRGTERRRARAAAQLMRARTLAPLAGLVVAGCLASKNDVVLLQTQLNGMQDAAARADTARARRSTVCSRR